ncbi:MAG: alpha/beta fold hydrolase [Gemmatimonadaceae bacterium]
MWPAGDAGLTVRYVPLRSGRRVRTVECGDPDGAPALFIHGWGCSSYVFAANLRPIAEHRTAKKPLRTIAFDLQGHGLSDKPGDAASYTLAAMTAHVVDVLDALELESATLVGHSLGGRIALELALARPERVRALALIAPVGLAPLRLAPLFPVVATPALIPLLPRLAQRRVVSMALRIVFGNRRAVSERDVAEFWSPTQYPAFLHALHAMLRVMDWSVMPRQRLGAMVPHVLAILGTADVLLGFPREGRASALTAFPVVEVVRMRGAGHAVQMEAPDEVNAALLRFLDEGA